MRLDLSQLWVFGLLVVLAALIGAGTVALGLSLFARLAERSTNKLDDILITHLRQPLQFLVPVLLVYPLLELTELPFHQEETIAGILKVLTVMLIAWLAIRFVWVVEEGLLRHFDTSGPDNFTARRVHTQIKLMRQVVLFVIVILTIAVTLMMFEPLRVIGVSMLASAGIAGLIIGLSAQKVLGNLLAGIQIAITQPIRLDDVVIVENEWGGVGLKKSHSRMFWSRSGICAAWWYQSVISLKSRSRTGLGLLLIFLGRYLFMPTILFQLISCARNSLGFYNPPTFGMVRSMGFR